MDIDGLAAGSELDWLVLHHALDWKLGFPALGQAAYTRPGPAGGRVESPALPPVSSAIGEAWALVEHVQALGLAFSLTFDPTVPGWEARIRRDRPPTGSVAASAPTAPLAIARATLKAVQASIVVKGFKLD
ncbi:MAG: hypothetical protein ACK46X_03590 [Candidatus Sericytochromatia bacterium]